MKSKRKNNLPYESKKYILYTIYEFEFDKNKSRSNVEKHGIDFVSAQELWNDPDLIEVRAKSDSEARFLLIARIEEKHWSAVITYRNNKIRIISVGRSRNSEVTLYES